jgi:hypothetical protein
MERARSSGKDAEIRRSTSSSGRIEISNFLKGLDDRESASNAANRSFLVPTGSRSGQDAIILNSCIGRIGTMLGTISRCPAKLSRFGSADPGRFVSFVHPLSNNRCRSPWHWSNKVTRERSYIRCLDGWIGWCNCVISSRSTCLAVHS